MIKPCFNLFRLRSSSISGGDQRLSIHIHLQQFEGPLDLLLYLIRKEEMDIFDIKINEITHQYLEYIKLMKELDLEVAGEFISMASTLIHIKSRMLLPQYDENGEIVENVDPRKELVQKLLEHQKFQEAARILNERPLVGRDIWLRGVREVLKAGEDEIILEENALFSLISSYRKVVRTMKKKIHQVKAKGQSIASRILEMKDRIIVGRQVLMSELITEVEEKRKQVLITFLALLELGKLGFVSLFQSDAYSEIFIDARKPIETDVVSRVEEYDSQNADSIAHKMTEKAEKEMAAAAAVSEVSQLEFKEVDDELTEKLMNDADSEESEIIFAEDELATDEEIANAEKELLKQEDSHG